MPEIAVSVIIPSYNSRDTMLPLLLFWRMTLRVLSARVYTKPFILASPLVFLGLVSWSWGECRGYLAQIESPTSASL
ncbi:MAG TPA: hypothetical protein VNO43_04355 [Candidatus Eisenbacteria bacterium]|nr:hypothetical protein [Candidatus Eisenbacteria bacterium]